MIHAEGETLTFGRIISNKAYFIERGNLGNPTASGYQPHGLQPQQLDCSFEVKVRLCLTLENSIAFLNNWSKYVSIRAIRKGHFSDSFEGVGELLLDYLRSAKEAFEVLLKLICAKILIKKRLNLRTSIKSTKSKLLKFS